MLRESNFLSGPGLGIVVGKFTFWNGPKLVAKVWKHEGGRSLRMAEQIACCRTCVMALSS
eukprot:220701-Pelagomonas_calceolata.AAC.1